jgi:hypothetical protein
MQLNSPIKPRGCWDSSDRIVIGCMLRGQGSITGSSRFLSIPQHQTDSGAHPASYSMHAWRVFLGVKRPGCEDDHPTPSSANSRMVQLYHYSNILWRGTSLSTRAYKISHFGSAMLGLNIPWIPAVTANLSTICMMGYGSFQHHLRGGRLKFVLFNVASIQAIYLP